MKLYEFTVTDEHNLPKSEIIKIADEAASEEAPLREWDSYKVNECKKSEQLEQGQTRYFFEVVGAYSPSRTSAPSTASPSPARRNSGTAAAPDLA